MVPFSGRSRSYKSNVNEFLIAVTVLLTKLFRMTLQGNLAGAKKQCPFPLVFKNCSSITYKLYCIVFVFHVFVRPCGHSFFRTNETRHMAEIHEVKHTAEIHTRNKTHGRDKEQRTTKLLPDKKKKTGTQICGK